MGMNWDQMLELRIRAKLGGLVQSILERCLMRYRKSRRLAASVRAGAAYMPGFNRILRRFALTQSPQSHRQMNAQQRSGLSLSAEWYAGRGNDQIDGKSAPLLQRADHIADRLREAFEAS